MSHQVSHVVHAQFVRVNSQWSLQVVFGNEHQILLPQFPAAPFLILQDVQRESAWGQILYKLMIKSYIWIFRGRLTGKTLTYLHPLDFITYLISVQLLVSLLPQIPVEIQPAVKRGRRPETQREEQDARQHQACRHRDTDEGGHETSGCRLLADTPRQQTTWKTSETYE